VINVFRY